VNKNIRYSSIDFARKTFVLSICLFDLALLILQADFPPFPAAIQLGGNKGVHSTLLIGVNQYTN